MSDLESVFAPHSNETIRGMQDDLFALIKAWEDRGVPPSDSAQMLTAVGQMMMIRLDLCTLGQLVAILAKQWERHGGRM